MFPNVWRAIWHYSRKRAVRDNQTLNQQEARALDIINGTRRPRKAKFVQTAGQRLVLDERSSQPARDLVGLKGYVTNITAEVMPAAEVIHSHHDLWHIEQSFRMSKTDLAARPIFHHTRDAIEAHLTIVFTALAITHDLQARSETSLKRIIQTQRPLRHVTIASADQQLEAEPAIPHNAATILSALGH